MERIGENSYLGINSDQFVLGSFSAAPEIYLFYWPCLKLKDLKLKVMFSWVYSIQLELGGRVIFSFEREPE